VQLDNIQLCHMTHAHSTAQHGTSQHVTCVCACVENSCGRMSAWPAIQQQVDCSPSTAASHTVRNTGALATPRPAGKTHACHCPTVRHAVASDAACAPFCACALLSWARVRCCLLHHCRRHCRWRRCLLLLLLRLQHCPPLTSSLSPTCMTTARQQQQKRGSRVDGRAETQAQRVAPCSCPLQLLVGTNCDACWRTGHIHMQHAHNWMQCMGAWLPFLCCGSTSNAQQINSLTSA
jgi:hypothetical protein